MPPSSGSACNNHAPPRSAWRSLSPLAPCGWRWHGSRCYEDNRPGVSAVCRVTSFRVWLYDPRRPTSEPVLRSLARLRFQRNTGTAKAKRLTRLKRPKNSPPIRAQEPGCGARYSLQRCRKQGAVHATGCKVQEAGCGAPCSSQRCRKQGAVHGLGVQEAAPLTPPDSPDASQSPPAMRSLRAVRRWRRHPCSSPPTLARPSSGGQGRRRGLGR